MNQSQIKFWSSNNSILDEHGRERSEDFFFIWREISDINKIENSEFVDFLDSRVVKGHDYLCVSRQVRIINDKRTHRKQ